MQIKTPSLEYVMMIGVIWYLKMKCILNGPLNEILYCNDLYSDARNISIQIELYIRFV